MASFFRNKVIPEVGTSQVTALETAANSRMTIIGMSLCNLTQSMVLVDVLVEDALENVGHYVHQMMIPANSSLRLVNGGEKLILAESNKLYMQSNIVDSIDVVISYVELI
jgi:hypothetical protein